MLTKVEELSACVLPSSSHFHVTELLHVEENTYYLESFMGFGQSKIDKFIMVPNVYEGNPGNSLS